MNWKDTLRLIWGIIRSRYVPPELDFSGELDALKLMEIIMDKMPEQVYISDDKYRTCTVNDLKRFLEWDRTQLKEYVCEYYDCDDFTWRLMGQITQGRWAMIPFGIVWTDKHALCCFVDNDNKFWYVEPQTDVISEELEEWQGSKIRFITI